MDSDAFLLALCRFIAKRGRPKEIFSDCGTNFRGTNRELPPGASHFGGVWEKEVCSIKNALQVAVRSQVVSEDVLYTVLVEVEGILNSKPLGYASADVADPDPITPNILLMGRRDASLPQAVYAPAMAVAEVATQPEPCGSILGPFHKELTAHSPNSTEIAKIFKKPERGLHRPDRGSTVPQSSVAHQVKTDVSDQQRY